MTGTITITAKEIEKDGKTGTQIMVLGHTRWSNFDRIKALGALMQALSITPMEAALAVAFAAERKKDYHGYDIKIPVNEGSTKEEAEP